MGYWLSLGSSFQDTIRGSSLHFGSKSDLNMGLNFGMERPRNLNQLQQRTIYRACSVEKGRR